jgi:hypothetical protein
VLPLEDITLATLIAVEVPAERILTDIACTLGLTRWLGDWPCRRPGKSVPSFAVAQHTDRARPRPASRGPQARLVHGTRYPLGAALRQSSRLTTCPPCAPSSPTCAATRTPSTAGLTMPGNSGPVEGHINRIKTIKRQTYGHTNPDLLRVRVPNNAH